jgi:hypothetical protein
VPLLKPEEEEEYEKRNQRDLVAADSIKSGYNPGSPSFIDIMQYHRGLLHQRGHGWGSLAKIAAKVAAPVIGQVVGGLLGGTQTGQGIQTGHGYADFLFNAAKGIAQTFSGHKIPISSKGGKLILDKKAIAQSGRGFDSFIKGLSRGVGFTGVNIIPQAGRGVKRVKRKKKQKGKGSITDLLKTGAKQALRAAAQTGLDILDNKRSLKDAIKTHGIRAIKSTAQPLLARGGPKRPVKRPQIKRSTAPIKKPAIKRPMKKPPMKKPPIKKPAIKRPAKRPKRALDIFD